MSNRYSELRLTTIMVLGVTAVCAVFASWEALMVLVPGPDGFVDPYGVDKALSQWPWFQLFGTHDMVALSTCGWLTIRVLFPHSRLQIDLMIFALWFLLMAGVCHWAQQRWSFPRAFNLDKAPYLMGELHLGLELFGGVRSLLGWSLAYCVLSISWAAESMLRFGLSTSVRSEPAKVGRGTRK